MGPKFLLYYTDSQISVVDRGCAKECVNVSLLNEIATGPAEPLSQFMNLNIP